MSERLRKRLAIALGLAVFMAAGAALERATELQPLRRFLRNDEVPAAHLDTGKLGELLRELGLVRIVPNDYGEAPSTEGVGAFPKKRRTGDWVYVARQHATRPPPVSTQHRTFLAIEIDEHHLYNPESGILVHSGRRGRPWERPASVALVLDGELCFATRAGLRLHGGQDRHAGTLDNSYRLYFRGGLGLPSVDIGIGGRPLERLVVRKDSSFTTAIAFDVARRIGCLVPEVIPVVLYVNGDCLGIYTLSEHLSREPWSRRLGHADFLFYPAKGTTDVESRERYRELHDWVQTPEVSLSSAATRVDLENLSAHLFSIMFCGTVDWRQGVAVLDEREEQPVWRWVNWDMDRSFSHYLGLDEPPWEQPGTELILGGMRWYKDPPLPLDEDQLDPREILFERLTRRSREFREGFLALGQDLLNHVLTPEYLSARMDHWDGEARRLRGHKFGAAPLRRIRTFLERRTESMRSDLQRGFGAGELFTVGVRGPEGSGLRVDGYAEGEVYRGEYFADSTIVVEGEVDHWLVDGERVDGARLEHRVTADVSIVGRN